MTPDFRFNKKITKELLYSSPKESLITEMSLDWKLNNNNCIYGSIKTNFLRNDTIFLLNKEEENYRLFNINKDGMNIYAIDDIDSYLKLIGAEELFTEDIQKEEILKMLKIISSFPCTGYIKIDNDKIFVYDFKI